MLPRFNISRTAFLLCDIQEKLLPTIQEARKVVQVAKKMLRGAEIFDIPVIVTEQYPKGLGSTASEIAELLQTNPKCSIFEKTQFSMLTPQVRSQLSAQSCESVVIFGLEAHVCVYQTVKDLLEAKFRVFMAADGIASRSCEDRAVALEQLARFGAVLSTSESILFELCQDAIHPKFKQMSELIKQNQIN